MKIIKIITILGCLIIGSSTNVIQAATPICPDTKFVNKSDEPWTDQDYKIFKSTKDGCIRHYNDVCVSKFIKLAPTNFHVICGKPVNLDNDNPFEILD
jgi:hypothetical protein